MKKEFLKIIVLAGFLSLACTTRVSEWVLLNAVPNQYTLVFFHNGSSGENFEKQNKEITGSIKNANIRFTTAVRKDIAEPYYGLYYEDRLFSKYSEPVDMKDLTSSPLREKIAAELMNGKLCVMVYLNTGITEKDEKGLRILNNSLKASPFGNIIPVVELSRNSSVEKHFVNMLLNVEDDLKTIREPMLFGVFGKFKALEPLLGRGITEENISLMIDFLTAECSCLIKDDLPGTDILFTDKWENPKPALLNDIIDNNLLPGE